MSIAVSAVVKPSKAMFALACGACLGNVLVGVVLATGQIGNWLLLPRLLLASGCVFLALLGFYHIAKRRRTLHIDISGVGQIRLREQLAGRHGQEYDDRDAATSEVVRLLPGSTLWPYLLLLRLQTDDGQIIAVPILPDCIASGNFRALAAACSWISTRNNLSASKIL